MRTIGFLRGKFLQHVSQICAAQAQPNCDHDLDAVFPTPVLALLVSSQASLNVGSESSGEVSDVLKHVTGLCQQAWDMQ